MIINLQCFKPFTYVRHFEPTTLANIRYPEKSTADDDVSIENKNEAEDKFDLK